MELVLSPRELLAQTLANQYLLKRVPRDEIVAGLGGLQAQFAANPRLALQKRASDYDAAHWGDGLVKIWSFRSTLHAVREEERGLFLSARDESSEWGDSWTGLKKEDKPYWSEFLLAGIRNGIRDREALKRHCLRNGCLENV